MRATIELAEIIISLLFLAGLLSVIGYYVNVFIKRAQSSRIVRNEKEKAPSLADAARARANARAAARALVS